MTAGRAKGDVIVLVGTTKGAFFFSSDARRKTWTIDGPHFAGQQVTEPWQAYAQANAIAESAVFVARGEVAPPATTFFRSIECRAATVGFSSRCT